MNSLTLFENFAAVCSLNGASDPTLFGLPKWYKYLDGIQTTPDASIVSGGNTQTVCAPQITALSDVLLIGASVLEALIRLAAMVAIVMIIWGGIKYVTSQGEPDKTEQARGTIINGIVGMIIAVAATATINFVAGRF